MSWAPVPNKPTVSVDVEQHFNFNSNNQLPGQNNNPRPIQRRWIRDTGERNSRKHNELLSYGQQCSPPPQIHPHSTKVRNHGLGYSSVDREKVHKLQSTGYQNSHQTKGDISVPPPSIRERLSLGGTPRLSLSRIHKRNSHLKCFDVS